LRARDIGARNLCPLGIDLQRDQSALRRQSASEPYRAVSAQRSKLQNAARSLHSRQQVQELALRWRHIDDGQTSRFAGIERRFQREIRREKKLFDVTVNGCPLFLCHKPSALVSYRRRKPPANSLRPIRGGLRLYLTGEIYSWIIEHVQLMSVIRSTRNQKFRIVIPGGSGQVGNVLASHFHTQGHSVTVLSRRPEPSRWQVLPWNGRDLGSWVSAIVGADIVINLAGRNVNCRYTPSNRREIMESRIFSTRVVGQAIRQAVKPPALWMNASTATIYRHALDRAMDESSGELGGHEPDAPSTWRFSIDVATNWEAEFFRAATPGTRKIALRSA